MTKVSIIVPVYNVYKYLDRCLDSLVNQTLEDIEIIVVNDGSPDNSDEIIAKYKKNYPHLIKSFKKENSGQGEARNFGLKHATGKYIMYVDSDDYVDKSMAEKLYNKALEINSDIVVCGNKVEDEINNKDILIESAYSYFNKNDLLRNFIFGKMAVWNKLYKKDLIIKNKINFRSKVWYEDLDFTTKVFFNASSISYVDEPLYNYILRNGSTMNNQNINRNLELKQSFDEVINYCKDNNLYDKYYSEIEFLCIYHMYISGISRIIKTKNKGFEKRLIINEYKNYIKNNFSNFKKNKYLKDLDRNKKIIYNLVNLNLYFVIKIIFSLKDKLEGK